MSGVHLGIALAHPQSYEHFAEESYLGFVRTGWSEVFMAHPRFWGLLLMAGELALGALLVVGGRAARAGWAGVITFHVLLMLFGWWVWVWSVPALVVLVLLARHDLASDHRPVEGADTSGRQVVS